MPTIRPNKRRLASIFMENSTIEWRVFEQRVRKAVRQTKHVQTRPKEYFDGSSGFLNSS
ncbi:hypothetical protein JHK87_001204 [Glycine soja]|nr:hypothetical protein JHK87_001204 [Glycine soja]